MEQLNVNLYSSGQIDFNPAEETISGDYLAGDNGGSIDITPAIQDAENSAKHFRDRSRMAQETETFFADHDCLENEVRMMPGEDRNAEGQDFEIAGECGKIR